MKDKSEQTKVEKSREAREKRINALKNKDGTKKKIKAGSRTARIMLPLVTVLIVVVFAVWIAFSTGFIQGLMKPVRIGDKAVSMKDYNYALKNTIGSYQGLIAYGMAPADANGKLDLTAKTNLPGFEGKTWRDYVIDQTNKQIQDQIILKTLADEKGYSFNEDDQEKFDDQERAFNKKYKTDEAKAKFLSDNFGSSYDMEYVNENVKKGILLSRFTAEYKNGFEISQDEIKKEYEANKKDYDFVDFRQFDFTKPKGSDGKPDESKNEELKKQAEEMLGKIEDEESFSKLASEYAPEESKSEYQDNGKTLQERKTYNAVSAPSEVKDWLFDSARKEGDKAVISSATGEHVLYFISRAKAENKMPTVRHILLGDPDAEGNPDEKQLAEDKKKAEEIASKIKSEEDMIKTGKEMKAAGTTREATLIENIRWGTMDPSFQDWIFDKSRKAGDVGVVKTAYGYHVVYFVKNSEMEEWQYQIDQKLRNKKFTEEQEKLRKEERFAIKRDETALKYAG